MTEEAHRKMTGYIGLCKGEVSGFGKVEIVDSTTLLVTDIIVLKQTVSGSTTDLDDDAIHEFMMDCVTKGDDVGSWKLWWHSHANMGVFWSGQDKATIDGFSTDWMLSIVGNRKGDLLARVDIYQPFPITEDKVPVVVNQPSLEDVIEIYRHIKSTSMSEVKAFVKLKKNTAVNKAIFDSFKQTLLGDTLEEEIKKKVSEKKHLYKPQTFHGGTHIVGMRAATSPLGSVVGGDTTLRENIRWFDPNCLYFLENPSYRWTGSAGWSYVGENNSLIVRGSHVNTPNERKKKETSTEGTRTRVLSEEKERKEEESDKGHESTSQGESVDHPMEEVMDGMITLVFRNGKACMFDKNDPDVDRERDISLMSLDEFRSFAECMNKSPMELCIQEGIHPDALDYEGDALISVTI